MKILVADVPADSGGGLSVLRDFYENTAMCHPEQEWLFLVSTNELPDASHIIKYNTSHTRKGLLYRLKWELNECRRVVRDFAPDVIFSLQNLILPYPNCPQVIYVHQPLPFQKEKKFSFIKSNERKLAFYQHLVGWLIKRSIKKADRVIVQTRWMAEEVRKYCGSSTDKLFMIPTPVTPIITAPTSSVQPTCNFFYPAGAMEYKNHRCIIEAVEMLKDRSFEIWLTLSGNENQYAAEIKAICEKKDLPVHFLGTLSRQEVFLRLGKSALIFPSLIETFGMPLAEARALGTYVLASDLSYAREVLTDYHHCDFFDPYNPDELAVRMRRLIDKGGVTTGDPFPFTGGSWSEIYDLITGSTKE